MRFGVSGSISDESLRSSAWTESGMFASLEPRRHVLQKIARVVCDAVDVERFRLENAQIQE